MKKTRRKFTVTFKAKVAIGALKERESLAELSKHSEVMKAGSTFPGII